MESPTPKTMVPNVIVPSIRSATAGLEELLADVKRTVSPERCGKHKMHMGTALRMVNNPVEQCPLAVATDADETACPESTNHAVLRSTEGCPTDLRHYLRLVKPFTFHTAEDLESVPEGFVDDELEAGSLPEPDEVEYASSHEPTHQSGPPIQKSGGKKDAVVGGLEILEECSPGCSRTPSERRQQHTKRRLEAAVKGSASRDIAAESEGPRDGVVRRSLAFEQDRKASSTK